PAPGEDRRDRPRLLGRSARALARGHPPGLPGRGRRPDVAPEGAGPDRRGARLAPPAPAGRPRARRPRPPPAPADPGPTAPPRRRVAAMLAAAGARLRGDILVDRAADDEAADPAPDTEPAGGATGQSTAPPARP